MKDESQTLGKYFVWIAWIIAIAILAYVFNTLLENQWNPNKEPQVFLNERGKAEVLLTQNRHGHYVVQGRINERAVTFLLDTGATQVSIPAQVAQHLSLPVLGESRVQTANGSINVYQTRIDTLSIGNIFLYNVAAHINPAMKSDEILLGMSALKQIEFSQTGNQLILREPH